MSYSKKQPLDYERRPRVKIIHGREEKYERVTTADVIRYGLRVVSFPLAGLAIGGAAADYPLWVCAPLFGIALCFWAAPALKDV